MISDIIRKNLSRKLTGQDEIRLTKKIPDDMLISSDLRALDQIGIYLHIPFCDQICPYCPYNKEIIRKETTDNYTKAVLNEIARYAKLLDGKEVSSLYIGGGTPTSMLDKGIEEIIEAIYRNFNMRCAIHMESHPNHLTKENLDKLETLGVKYLSIGVEALQDRHLKVLERPYTVNEVKKNVERAVSRNFECVNIDYMFDLPDQKISEVEQATIDMVKLGVQQAATYPLFRFSYTRFGKEFAQKRGAIPKMFRRKKFLNVIEDIFYDSGYERSSVWAFTKTGVGKYCSVTVPSYIGIGASGGSYLKNMFYVNTFKADEYIKSIANNHSPIALSIDLSLKAQMAGWLYWRIYETKFNKSDFQKRFGQDFDKEYGNYMKMLEIIGFLENGENHLNLTDKGTYWIHAFEDFFSIDYINKLWGTARKDPWPELVEL